MASIYRDQVKSRIGLLAYDAGQSLFRPRSIEDRIIGFGTPSDNVDAVEGVFAHQGERFIVRIERIV